jgi:hypothetical protein
VFGSLAHLVVLLEQPRARNVILCVANFCGFFCPDDFLRGDVFRNGVTNDIGLSVGDWCGVLRFADLGNDKMLE